MLIKAEQNSQKLQSSRLNVTMVVAVKPWNFDMKMVKKLMVLLE